MAYRDVNNQFDREPEVEPQDALVTCPQCDAQQDESECFLGRLGFLVHYRCRYCGITFSHSPLSRDIDALEVK